LLAGAALSACSAPDRIAGKDKGALDCLASKTVVKLTAMVRDGFKAGKQQSELSGLQASLTAAGLQSAKALFPDKTMHHAYYEFETAKRATAVQIALTTRDNQSEAYQLMNETMDLGQTCVIEGSQ